MMPMMSHEKVCQMLPKQRFWTVRLKEMSDPEQQYQPNHDRPKSAQTKKAADIAADGPYERPELERRMILLAGSLQLV